MTPEKPNFSQRIHALVSIVYLVFGAATAIAALHLTNETDHQALLSFKAHITSDPFEALSSWNDSTHFCDWTGVTCGKKHQRVTRLWLPALRLVGPLSPHIGNLTFLRVLNLEVNHFNGVLPHEIGQLSRLQDLVFSNNSFEGELPRNLTNCADLRILGLDGNDLWGQIPNEVGSLTKLGRLWLHRNRLTGQVPPVLGNLSALFDLSLGHNHIQGTIPSQLGHLSNLKYLTLESNNLSGHIPTSLYNISSILVFSVALNTLEGSLPSDTFSAFPKLEELCFDLNKFSGLVPRTLTNASRAVRIDFSYNAFVGPLPVDLGGLRNLQLFNFGRNNLGTEDGGDLRFLTSLINCTKLQLLCIAENRLKGVLPDSIANLSSTLIELYMEENIISGTITSGVENLVSLQLLALNQNMLTGGIPSSVMKLPNLQELVLGFNNLSGVIPSSLGNLTSLSVLYLGHNMLEGAIPASLGKCTRLNVLHLGYNLLVGTVPQELLGLSSLSRLLVLAGNYLTGPISSEVGKLVNLRYLDVSENLMSGEIPPTLGDCKVLEYLYLGGNQFNGSIPLSMSNLRGLASVNLSRNNFSGEIPGFLADLPLIESLDLSFNTFEGEVPNRGIFLNLSAVSVVGNNKLCGGPPSLQLPKCEGGATKKNTKKALTRRTVLVITVTISIFSFLVGVVAVILCRLKRTKSRSASASSTREHHPTLSYGELSRATDGFSPANMIGEGSFGAVYKGVLPSNGQIIAVKVLKLEEQSARKSFMAECKVLRNIRHRNLVKTITACSTVDFQGEDFKALVFEFMPNGSLEKWLHPVPDEIRGNDNDTRLSVSQRLNIAIDVAAAMDYLHHQCHIPIVHSDLKPSNVLLDSDFSAHVSDFGLAKFLAVKASGTQSSSIGIRGTIGYVAPEYGVGGNVSTRGDIYSFGILLLELFTGKRPTEHMFGGEFGLREFVQKSLPNPDGLNHVIDPLLCLGEARNNLQQCLISVLEVGLMCSAAQANERMDIGEAAAVLKKARDALPVGRRGNRV